MRPAPQTWKTPLAALGLVLLAAGIVGLQFLIAGSLQRRRVEKLLYVPNGTFLRPAVLGYDQVASDYYWLKTIGYFGGHYMADKQYPWLAHILQLVTDLDPRLSIAYYFGGIVLAVEAGQVNESIRLLEKGMGNLPERWNLPFFAGFNYFYYKGDLETAADYLARAAALPGSPAYLPRLAASLYAKAGNVEDAVRFLETIRASIDDERVRSGLDEKIRSLKEGQLPLGLEKVLSGGV